MTFVYRSLSSLEDRYSELREIGEQHLKLFRDKEAEFQLQIASERSEADRRLALVKAEAAAEIESVKTKAKDELIKETNKLKIDFDSEADRRLALVKAEAAAEIESVKTKAKDELIKETNKLKIDFDSVISASRDKADQLDQELQDARREIDLCLLRLNQVQEELAHYFKLSQAQSRSLEVAIEARDRLSKDLDDIRTSTIWRATRPLRKILDRIRLLRSS